MTAKEIRLGNIVNYKYWNPNPKGGEWCFEMVEIVGLLQDNFYFKFRNNNSVKKIKELYPIELTEDILLKCRFIEDDFNKNGGLYLSLKNTCLDGHLDYFYLKKGLNVVNLRSIRSVEIKHLHQLQNLYFALTGEELEIKL